MQSMHDIGPHLVTTRKGVRVLASAESASHEFASATEIDDPSGALTGARFNQKRGRAKGARPVEGMQ